MHAIAADRNRLHQRCAAPWIALGDRAEGVSDNRPHRGLERYYCGGGGGCPELKWNLDHVDGKLLVKQLIRSGIGCLSFPIGIMLTPQGVELAMTLCATWAIAHL